MTYEETICAYHSILEANPGNALLIDDGCYAVMLDGYVCSVFLEVDGSIDLTTAHDFDKSAWDTEFECWNGDVSGMETIICVSSPTLVQLETLYPNQEGMGPRPPLPRPNSDHKPA